MSFFVIVWTRIPPHTASFWDITIQWISHDDLTEKSAEFRQNWTEAVFSSNCKVQIWIFFASIIPQSVFWSKSSNWSRGQTHDLILLKFFFYYISFYSIFSRLSLFHREWPQLATILTSFNLYLETVSKLLNIGIKASHSRWKQLDMQRIE